MLSPEQYVDTLKIDEDELEELAEELAKAAKAWDSTIKTPEIVNFASKDKDVEKLLRAIGTNYKDDIHGVELKAIACQNSPEDGGVMSKEIFCDWYIRWMFTPEDTEGIEDAEDAEPNVDFKFKLADFRAKDAVDGETWKCKTCKIMNKWLSGFCKGCELKAPHYDTLPAESRKAPAFVTCASAPIKDPTGPKIIFGSSSTGGGFGGGFGSSSSSSTSQESIPNTSSNSNNKPAAFFVSSSSSSSSGGFKPFSPPVQSSTVFDTNRANSTTTDEAH